jgi:hypothetical protein
MRFIVFLSLIFVLISVFSVRGCGWNACGLYLLFSGAKAGKLGGLALLASVFCFLFGADFFAANVCNKR